MTMPLIAAIPMMQLSRVTQKHILKWGKNVISSPKRDAFSATIILAALPVSVKLPPIVATNESRAHANFLCESFNADMFGTAS